MTVVPRLQQLPPPGSRSGLPAVALPGLADQPVKPVLPARTIQGGKPDPRQPSDADRVTAERRVDDRRIADRQDARARIEQGGEQGRSAGRGGAGATAPEPAGGRLIDFSRLSSMPFMVQVLGQEGGARPVTLPQSSLDGHRDAALLGSDIYRRAGGEPEFLPETATFVRLAV